MGYLFQHHRSYELIRLIGHRFLSIARLGYRFNNRAHFVTRRDQAVQHITNFARDIPKNVGLFKTSEHMLVGQ